MNVAAFLIYCMIVTFTPGPTNIAILSIAHNFRLKKTFRYIWGATAAFGILLVASVVLNSALVAAVPKILIVMQVTGSFYMLYLAYQVYRADISGDAGRQVATFISGFLMQLVNPKVWLFTLTVVPGYVMPYYPSWLILSVFALIITMIAFSAMATWALFGTAFKKFLQKYQKAANTILAMLLVYSAAEMSGIIELLKRR